MIILGVDPDSDKSGIAVYENGELTDLECLDIFELFRKFETILICEVESAVELHIENVCEQNAAFRKSGVRNKQAATAINRSVGKCQQVQLHIECIARHMGIKIVRHRISSMWKDKAGKAQFERVTGWKGRSNEDSRSAAFFGHQGVLMSRGK